MIDIGIDCICDSHLLGGNKLNSSNNASSKTTSISLSIIDLLIMFRREIPEYVLNKFKEYIFPSICLLNSDGGKLYSQVYFNQTEGIAWGYLKNVCYNMKTQFMELYKPTEDKIIRGRIEGFQHLWVYKEFVGEMKEEYQINRGLNAWMIIPGWTKHTSHFSQNVFFINHRNSHPTWYPPVCLDDSLLLLVRWRPCLSLIL